MCVAVVGKRGALGYHMSSSERWTSMSQALASLAVFRVVSSLFHTDIYFL